MEAAVNEPDKDKQREMVKEIMDSPEMELFKQTLQKAWECIREAVLIFFEEIKKVMRLVSKQNRINSFRRQHIKHKRWCY